MIFKSHKRVAVPKLTGIFILIAVFYSAQAQVSTYSFDPPGNLTSSGIIRASPPVITTQPKSLLFQTNGIIQFAISATGSGLSYQWLSNGIPLIGATQNALNVISAVPVNNWTTNGGSILDANGLLTLTDAQGYESRSAFYNIPQGITNFTATFTYLDVIGGGGDGAAFVLQNAPNGVNALGGYGGGFGYSGITPSAAIEFNVYNGAPGGVGIAFATNGLTASSGGLPYVSPGSVNLASGHPINVLVQYSASNLNLTLTDVTAGASFATNYFVNLPAVIGGSNAYVGFSGGTGAAVSKQKISRFTFVSGSNSPASLLAAPDPSFSVVVRNSFGVITSTPVMYLLDSNGNGLPDKWEIQYFGNLDQTPAGDYDGDGVNNLTEYLEGTDPGNAASLNPRLYLQGINGQAIATPSQAFYTNGQVVTLTAIADAGQQFLGWSGSVTSSMPFVTVVMNHNQTNTATFGLPLALALDNTNLNWTTGSNAWFGQTQISEDGSGSAQSGFITAMQQTSIQAVTNLTQPMVLSFWWSVSSQPPDGLTFSVDGTNHATLSGTTNGWQHVLLPLAAGNHTNVWTYAKTSNGNPTGIPFADSGWVDEVTLGIPPMITGISPSQVGSQGSNLMVAVTATGTPPLGFQWYFNGNQISGGNAGALFLNNLQPASAGGYSVIVTNIYGSVTSSVASLIVNSTSCIEPPAGLTGWWPGDGNAVDVVGGNDAILQMGASYTNGLVGMAFYCNGISNYVQLPDNCFPFPSSGITTNTFSFALWFKTSTGGVILGQQNSSPFQNPSGYSPMIYVGTDGLIHSEMFWSGAFSPLVGNTIVTDGNYHQLTLVFNGAIETLYVDGITNGSKAIVEQGWGGPYKYQFGTGFTTGRPAATNGWYSFNGILDEPSFYSRDLSPSEVQSIYQAGGGGLCKPIPILQSFTPGIAGMGGVFSLIGTNLFSVTNVTLNGQPANFTRLSGQQIAVVVPPNAHSGPVAVYASGGSFLTASNFLVISNPSCTAQPPGLIDWWPAEGNGQDLIGGHTALLQNWVTFSPGKSGYSFTFDGSSGYLNLGNWFNLQNFTISMWVNPSASQQFSSAIIDNNRSSSASWDVEFQNQGLSFNWSEMWGQGELGAIPFSLTPNAWQHLVISVDSNYVSRVYLNSLLVNVAQHRPIYYDGNQFLRLGKSGSGYFKGQLDEVAIFNRSLSGTEVQNLYLADSSSMCAAQPIITSIYPASGAPGSVVLIQGTNFFTINSVLFNGTPASYTIQPDGSLTAYVPTNSTSGSILLVTPGGPVIALANFSVLTASQCSPLASGAVAWWPGEGNALDIASTNNGVLQGGVTFSTGVVAQALNFDGTNGGMSLTNLGGLSNGNAPHTLEGWVKITHYPSNRSWMLLLGNEGSSSHHWLLHPDGSTQLGVWGGTQATPTLPLGIWIHLALTYDGQKLSCYTNGILQSSQLASFNFGNNLVPLTIASPHLGDQWFGGLFDEFAVYNRALSATEILDIYNSGSVGKCQQPLFDASFTGIQSLTDGLHFKLIGRTGHGDVVFYASTNLISWNPIYTNVATNGAIQFIDMRSTNFPFRFYRAIEQ